MKRMERTAKLVAATTALVCSLGAESYVEAQCIGGAPDGIFEGAEQCDDANAVAGDGCNASCASETGFTCRVPVNSDGRYLALTIENYSGAAAGWSLDPNGRAGTQQNNTNHGTIGLFGADAFSSEFSIDMSVTGTSDDDFIGFVIGFQPGDATNANADFLLLDWKKANQPDQQAVVGMALSRVRGVPSGANFWAHAGAVTEIARSTNFASTGWAYNTSYRFRVTYSPSLLVVEVNGAEEFRIAAPSGEQWPAGELGFYGLSQPNVRYEIAGPLYSVCTPVCGDGLVLGAEACDDTNRTANDGCSAACQVETGWTCPSGMNCVPNCGDGLVLGSEACDDGNLDNLDGCSSACVVEHAYACNGQPSVCLGTCGDGQVAVSAEACDDGNGQAGDGCAACVVEAGFSCAGEPSVCMTGCGDGIPAGMEGCDDNNLLDDDGCDAACQPEHGFSCSGAPSVCIVTCGDGLIAPSELCDDGNASDADGCSSGCAIDPGYSCSGEPSVCVMALPDAGPGDAGVDASVDSGRDAHVADSSSAVDAGADSNVFDAGGIGGISGGGCGCSVGESSSSWPMLWLTSIGLGTVLVRRRRRR